MINTQNTVICTGSREPPQTLWLAFISFVHCIPSLSTMNGTEKLLNDTYRMKEHSTNSTLMFSSFSLGLNLICNMNGIHDHLFLTMTHKSLFNLELPLLLYFLLLPSSFISFQTQVSLGFTKCVNHTPIEGLCISSSLCLEYFSSQLTSSLLNLCSNTTFSVSFYTKVI